MAIFCDNHISNHFNKIYESIREKIESYDYRQLKDFSPADIQSIVDYFHQERIFIDFNNAIKEPSNGEDKIYNNNHLVFDDENEYIIVKGKHIAYHAPIVGEWPLLKYSLGEQGLEMFNYCDENYESIDIVKDNVLNVYCLSFTIFVPDFDINGKTKEEVYEIVDAKKNEYLHTTLQKIDKLNNYINSFNKELPEIIKKCIQEKISDDSSLAFLSDAIGVEVHAKNPSQTKGSKIEIFPKKVDLFLPDRKKYDGYYLDKENYSAIISTIKNHLIATENNPMAIKKLNNEELIRDTILWSLNSNYFVATGESFRNNGKTDILITFKDKTVFLAECKKWNGKKYIYDGINQMLGYTTWRDSKMALIILNFENKDFSLVCSETKECLKVHPSFKRITNIFGQNHFECELIDGNNQDSTITITVLCANYVDR